MKKNRMPRWAALSVVGLAILPSATSGQDAADLMRRAMAAQAERLSGVENVTIVQETMGMEMSMYMEKRDAGGTPILMPVSVTVAGMTNAVPQDMAQADWSNPFQEEWVEHTRFVGREDLDGETVLVFVIDDFSGIEVPEMPGAGDSGEDFQPKSFRYSMTDGDFLLRHVQMEGEAVQDDGSLAPVKMNMFLGDYREVDGYVHPFETRVITEGVLEAANVDRQEIQRQLEQMQAQLDQMPEAQRAMMEQMMGPQIEQLKEMLGGDGTIEMTLTVKELKVNAGGSS